MCVCVCVAGFRQGGAMIASLFANVAWLFLASAVHSFIFGGTGKKGLEESSR